MVISIATLAEPSSTSSAAFGVGGSAMIVLVPVLPNMIVTRFRVRVLVCRSSVAIIGGETLTSSHIHVSVLTQRTTVIPVGVSPVPSNVGTVACQPGIAITIHGAIVPSSVGVVVLVR
jgi:hypothetical protein